MSNKITAIGEAISRIDGFLKVTGTANYAMDFPVPNSAFAVLIKSEIAAGKIVEFDSSAAEKAEGIAAVISFKNAPKINVSRGFRGGGVLQDSAVRYFGENIGVVVAETFEQANFAADLIKVRYEKTEQKVDLGKLEANAAKTSSRPDNVRGDFEKAFNASDFKVDEIFETPIEHHHAMAPHATTAIWERDDKLILYNESQVVNGVQAFIASVFDLPRENVRVITPHIGGGFGSKGGAWGHVAVAAMAAKFVKRPVKLALTRTMMVNSVGLRQKNIQHLKIGATKEGKLTAIAHETATHAAINEEFIESCGDVSNYMYDIPNASITYKVAPMNILTPTFVRGPGKTPGSFALESAIDELAYKLKIDPIEFRLKNEPAKDPSNGKPWSSRSVVECLKKGAEVFGWKKRKMEPRQLRDGAYLIGYGVACGSYPARQRDTSANVLLKRIGEDVTASIELAASDLGTGTHTIIAQTAAETLNLPMNKIGVKIGDSDLPPAAGSVGSVGAASFANAVYDGCLKAIDELQKKTNLDWFAPPTVLQLMQAAELTEFQTRVDAKPPANVGEYSSHAFNANFVEVRVDDLTGMVRVNRFVCATGAGRILNPKTSHSQMLGGGIWGIGMALSEESVIDPRYGNFVTRSFGEYHIPSNLDIGEMETIFINEEDKIVNKLGVKGIGEVGIVGVAAAVANAVFNATGRRVRNLPITPDKLI